MPQIKTCTFSSLITVHCCSDCCLMSLSCGQTRQNYTADWICIFCAAVSLTSVERGNDLSNLHYVFKMHWFLFSVSVSVVQSHVFMLTFFLLEILAGLSV